MDDATTADTYAHALRLLDLLELDLKRLHDCSDEPAAELLKDCTEHRLHIANKLRFAWRTAPAPVSQSAT